MTQKQPQIRDGYVSLGLHCWFDFSQAAPAECAMLLQLSDQSRDELVQGAGVRIGDVYALLIGEHVCCVTILCVHNNVCILACMLCNFAEHLVLHFSIAVSQPCWVRPC